MVRICTLVLAAASIAFPNGRPARGDEPAKAAPAPLQSNGSAAVDQAETLYRGKTIAAWIRELDDHTTRDDAIHALAVIGAPAALELAELVERRDPRSGYAFQTLAKMGEAARGALPALVELAADKDAKDPEGWPWNVPIRALLFSEVSDMGWAADEWIPVLRRTADDATESSGIRTRAIAALGGMGAAKARPILDSFAESDNDEIRIAANAALARISGRPKDEFYGDLVELNPLDPNVPEYLAGLKSRFNHGQFHTPTQRVKAALREHLATQPDAKLAWALATIIRNGMANSELMFAAPSNSVRSTWDREDPAENFTTLAESLEICLQHAPKDSDLARRAGLSLARLRLLQGDFNGMNATLEQLGQQPIAAADRAWLAAPPSDWSRLSEDWRPADAAMRSGACALEFQFEKRGAGLAGAHVLIKRLPEGQQRRAFTTGIAVDTLLYATQPLDADPYDPFGYYATDRAATRYGVSGADGKIRFEGLPNAPIRVEILIPMGNFAERWPSWELLMETAPGQLQTTNWGRKDSVRRSKGPAVVQLREGETVRYPKLIVRPARLGEGEEDVRRPW